MGNTCTCTCNYFSWLRFTDHFTFSNVNVAESCVDITQPTHGGIQCSGLKVTDEHCVFTCDPGYSLSGSAIRTCQANHTWDGEDVLCIPKKCPELTPPANALVISPCNSEFESTCQLLCEGGYHVVSDPGSREWTQTCDVNEADESVQWTESIQCSGILYIWMQLWHTLYQVFFRFSHCILSLHVYNVYQDLFQHPLNVFIL